MLTGSALGLAACSKAALPQLSSLAPLAKQAATPLLHSNATGPAALIQGYNSVLGNAVSTALMAERTTISGQSSVVCTVCTSASQVANALEIDASLSVAYGPLASVDVKTQFMSSLEITTYSITIVVHAKKSIGEEQYTNARLKSGVVSPTTAQETDDFVRVYGDSFISKITKGGEYFATYTFFSETRTEQESLKASMQASGIYSGVSVGGGLQVAMNKFVSTTKTTSTFKQTITGFRNTPVLPDASNFTSFANTFPSLELTSPAIIGFTSQGYESGVEGFKAPFFAKVAENRRYFTVDSSQRSLASSLATIAEIKNQITSIKQIYDWYGYTSDSLLSSRLSVVNTDLDAIRAQMQAFETSATSSFTRPSLPSLANGTPALTYSVASSPDWGQNGGTPFNDVDVTTYLQDRTRISQVQLRAGAYVDKIITTYETAKGKSWVKSAGGPNGTLSSPLQLQQGQSVRTLLVRAGNYIDKIGIAASDGRYIIGGENGGVRHDWTAPSGAIVMGFHGRAGSFLDKIGVDYALIKPATWNAVAATRNMQRSLRSDEREESE